MQVLVRDVMVTAPKILGPDATVNQIRLLFEDDHVHMAVIVDGDRRLLTAIDRSDIPPAIDGTARASSLGTVAGRTINPDCLLSMATSGLQSSGRRRLAVTDEQNRLLGLLCLKRSGNGYCSDEGVRARAEER
jgi:predicted transcriptional regulator